MRKKEIGAINATSCKRGGRIDVFSKQMMHTEE